MIYGVTIDQLTDVPQTALALSSLPKKPTIRLVVDPGTDIHDYVTACRSFRPASIIMPQICDSYGVAKLSVSDYIDKTELLLESLGTLAWGFEVGNEVNGDWCGWNVWEKVDAAKRLVINKGFPSVLTLYYDDNVWNWIRNSRPWGGVRLRAV